ncbi:hypothetical protein [Qipengyuania huizhouensis]|uniref:hypothetical protein n=1 Tax=Qipengyuania huizhouensis TaxID=2867245 RepID=UPI001C886778|nr:hypothetical protein [Qipengyuania huizhouensis]
METRKSRSALHDKLTWNFVLAIARWEQPRTLRGYVSELNDIGHPSASGSPWTTQKLHNVFKRHNTTAKKLTAKVNQPAVYELPQPPTKAARIAFRKAIEGIDQPSVQNGSWRPATEIQPRRSDLVRHGEFGVGQYVKEEAIARFLCRFIDDEHGSFDAQIPASQLEVFQFHLSREERQQIAERLAEKWL